MSPKQRARAYIYRFRGGLIVLAVILVTATTAIVLSTFGASGLEETPALGEDAVRVRTGGERCAVPVFDGWTWRAASWTLVSPNGTTVGFSETLHGRPMYVEWDEKIEEMAGRYDGRDDVTVTHGDQSLRIDFGPDDGLSVSQRFDRVGCHLTFAPPADGVRSMEIDTWEELVSSVQRVYPQEGVE